MQNLKYLFLILFININLNSFSQETLSTPNVEAVLYVGAGEQQPLIVGLGGSEGGNAWTSDNWKKTREQFISKGYAFLAIGYFGAKGTPDTLNKIALEDVHQAILVATKNKQINKNKIAIVGGSRGADLALLLGSYYPEIKCVVGLVASSVIFPGHTNHFSTAAFTFNNQELPFVPVSDEAIPYLMKRDLRGAFETMLKDSLAAERAAIKVENINGPILLISATADEVCPSTPMAEAMLTRLKNKSFKHPVKHVAIEGGHAEPLKHFDIVFDFLEKQFLKK